MYHVTYFANITEIVLLFFKALEPSKDSMKEFNGKIVVKALYRKRQKSKSYQSFSRKLEKMVSTVEMNA